MPTIDFPGEKPSKAEISRERVTQAGAQIFRERGYAGTTMRAVADKVGLKAGSLYYHYKSKADLVTAILETGVGAVAAEVSQAIATLPPSSSYLDRLEVAIRAHLRAVVVYEDYSLASRRVFGQVPPEVRRKYVRQRNAYGQLWHQLLESAQAAGEIRPDVDLKLAYWFILGALNASAEWRHPETQSVEYMGEQFFKLISNGLGTDVASSMSKPGAATRRAV